MAYLSIHRGRIVDLASATWAGFIGSGATDLDAYPTVNVAVGARTYVASGGISYTYVLEAGTDAEASPEVIRPDDYAAATNEKIWRLYEAAALVTSVNGQNGAVVLTTTNVAEGTNLYYTQARFDTAFGLKSTTNLAEGTNLYYTTARFDTAFAAKTTTDLAEGTNKYFTDARAIAAPLTGFAASSGTVIATDTILQAIQRLEGRVALDDAKVTGSDRVLRAGDTMTGALVINLTDTNTATAPTVLSIAHTLSSGTAANNIGATLDWNIDSNTTALTRAARWSTIWTNATHAARTATTTISSFVGGTDTNQLVIGNNQIGGPVGTAAAPSYADKDDLDTGLYFPGTNQVGLSTAGAAALTIDSAQSVTLAARLLLPNTSSATVGGIYFGGNRFAHNFGTNNIFLGLNAGNFTLTGSDLLGFGPDSLKFNTSGFRNVAVGSGSLVANTTGFFNTAMGYSSLAGNTTGAANTAHGDTAATNQATGDHNTCIGFGAGFGVASNSYSDNTIVGSQAGYVLTTGSNNVLFGRLAGNNLTTGSRNIVIGYDIDSPTATNSNTITIGNLIFGINASATGTTIAPSGKVGIGVITPTEELAVASTAGAACFSLYETSTVTTNYARLLIATAASGNTTIQTQAAGTGLISDKPRILQVGTGPSVGADKAGQSFIIHSGQPTGNAAPGAILFQQGLPAGGSSSTATALATIWSISTAGVLTGASGFGITLVAANIATDTTTGSKLGTATDQKWSFWNATPIIQPTTAVAAATFVANTSLIANDSATWDGYTAGQVVKALRNFGILA